MVSALGDQEWPARADHPARRSVTDLLLSSSDPAELTALVPTPLLWLLGSREWDLPGLPASAFVGLGPLARDGSSRRSGASCAAPQGFRKHPVRGSGERRQR